MGKQVILVCGPMCAGKTSYCKSRIAFWGRTSREKVDYIKVSDTVRELSNASNRSELQDTKKYDKAIARKLVSEMLKKLINCSILYVDGIRQLSILQKIVYEMSVVEMHFVQVKWLSVDKGERRNRFEKRKSPKDLNLSFDEADQRDYELGLDELERYLTNTSFTI